MPRPNIQIEDEVREMTEEEYANYILVRSGVSALAEPEEPPA